MRIIMAEKRSRIKVKKVIIIKEGIIKEARGMLKRIKEMEGEKGRGMGRRKRTTGIKSEEEKN